MIQQTIRKVKDRLIEIYSSEGHSNEEVVQYWEKISAEMDSQSLRQIVEGYGHIYKFGKRTLARAYEVEGEFSEAPKTTLNEYLYSVTARIGHVLIEKFKQEKERTDQEISEFRQNLK